jgi:shikimate 5-dehydrogenase
MLFQQAIRQFELYTRHAPPIAEMESALAEGLGS